jgi:hypothetical protein
VWVQYYYDKSVANGMTTVRQGFIGAVGDGPTLLENVDGASTYPTESKAIETAQQYISDHSWRTTWEQKP